MCLPLRIHLSALLDQYQNDYLQSAVKYIRHQEETFSDEILWLLRTSANNIFQIDRDIPF